MPASQLTAALASAFPETSSLYSPAVCSRSTPSSACHTVVPLGAAASDCQNGISLSVHLPTTSDSGFALRTSTSNRPPWLADAALTRSSTPSPQSYLLQVEGAVLRGACFLVCPAFPRAVAAKKTIVQIARHSLPGVLHRA